MQRQALVWFSYRLNPSINWLERPRIFMSDMLTRRDVYKPFEYPQASDYWLQQQQAHWIHTEVSMASDIHDWAMKMTPAEKHLIGTVLKGFTQTEVIVNDYWSRRVSKWFPKPEIVMMASALGNMETVHMNAYALLNDSLGLDDFAAFLDEPSAAAKLSHLIETDGSSLRGIARSLAVFSAFAEGVQLFSSFAVLMNFSRFNKLKGVGQIVAFSVRDESLHSEAGCWLFRTLVSEHPELFDDEMKKELYDAARAAVTLEDDFLERAFDVGAIEGLTLHDMKQFVRHRANAKLSDIGLKSNWKNIDKAAIERMEWFDFQTSAPEHQDFFAQRVTSYSKSSADFSQIWDEQND